MELLFRYLFFAIFLQQVICNLGDDLVFDILSNRLDYVSITLAKIARKQKDIESKLEINAKLLSGNREHDQHSDTGSASTERGYLEELSVIKKAIASEKEYVRNQIDSMEKKFDAIANIQPPLDDSRRISQIKFADQTDSADLRSRIQDVEKDLQSFKSFSNNMENRLDQLETNIKSIESEANFLENRTDSIAVNLEYVDKITGKIERRVDSVEKEKNEIDSKLKIVETDIESVESMTNMIKVLVDSVESKIDFVELASDVIERRIDTMETSIEIITEAANKKVSFSSLFKPASEEPAALIGKNKIIPFNHAFNNEGSGLNTTSGIFTVPVAGVYQFIYFVESWFGEGESTCPAATVVLFIDNTATPSVAIADPRDQIIQSGNQYISYLRKGQQVGLGTTDTCEKHIIVGYRTTFSGVLLF